MHLCSLPKSYDLHCFRNRIYPSLALVGLKTSKFRCFQHKKSKDPLYNLLDNTQIHIFIERC